MNILELFQPIRAFAFDMDGVLTDGGVLVLEDGQQVRRMHTRDGYALQLAIRRGYHVVVISGGNSAAARLRLTKLGITDVHMSIDDKLAVLQQYMAERSLAPHEVLYMGDDIPDLQPMEAVGLPCCPADAATEILRVSKYISPVKGGEGCVRDVIEKVLKLNDDWATDHTPASK
ncbi:KdsC family phosphatase [Dinghuibacter silviterrae]|uniref:3-deoxy-D-manno-octulosonate 8-phosphate phosphatase (KDO 8-P phosphatase) n=1 Tax=Dinghuibacter silviterrae TaxID=1539049 RepID=A0A4R8DUY7_9BACT|nr:3-deoxy-D-manno-octulosonate 8-phosphate phosphatase [Dinghuibacter silviterrae]TDX01786.1 3-deoxy-D-manno-octulosonate 8-phosphate phosphatase (KDO 8-P phosphatase) [Dinghuibacter silviterrae]